MKTVRTHGGIAAIRRRHRMAVPGLGHPDHVNRSPLLHLWRFTLLWAMLVSLDGFGAEPIPKPMLLHNLESSQPGRPGPFSRAVRRLETLFELRTLPSAPSVEELRPAKLVWLVLPGRDEPAIRNPTDVAQTAAVLSRYVTDGGALLVMTQRAPGEPGSALARALMTPLGLVQNSRRTGAKQLRIPDRLPLIGGLVWSTGGITPLDAEENPALRKAVLIPNDLAQKPLDPQDPDYAGLAMIWGELGRGRIVVVGDVEWLRNPTSDTRVDPDEVSSPNAVLLGRLADWAGTRSPTAR